MPALLFYNSQQLAELVLLNNAFSPFDGAMAGEFFDLMQQNGVGLRRCFGQDANGKLAAGAGRMAGPERLAKLTGSGGDCFEQALGLDIDLMDDPFDVFIFDLAECHENRVPSNFALCSPTDAVEMAAP